MSRAPSRKIKKAFQICEKKGWAFLIRFKEGSIPTLAGEYRSIREMGDNEETVV